MLNQWIEVFKAGKHTDSSGNTKNWTEKDIDTIIAKYNPAEHEAPIVKGHPKDKGEAYGWVEALKRKGKVLLAKFKQLAPEFVELVKAGRYKKRSISLYPDLKLRHVGFLGAVPPAVKGLKDIEFNEEGKFSIEFSDNGQTPITIEFEEKPESAEKNNTPEVENNMDWEKIANELKEEKAKLEADNETLKTANKNFSEKLEIVTGELETSKLKITELEGEKRTAEFNSFCDSLVEKGKMTPAETESVLKTMTVLADADVANFSEGKQTTCLDDYKKTLEKRPEVLEYKELATKKRAAQEAVKDENEYSEFSDGEVIPEAAELDRNVKKVMAEKNISYTEALSTLV